MPTEEEAGPWVSEVEACFCLSQGLPRNNVQNKPELVEAGSRETY